MGVKVREKPNGSGIWWIFIDYQGKRKAKKVGKDKKTAQQLARVLEAKLVLGEGKPEEKPVTSAPLFNPSSPNFLRRRRFWPIFRG
jgi:integrase